MAPPPSISRITVTGLYGRQTLDLNLRAGLNIVYGKNGSGKTTLLHILANLLHCDIARFCNIRFTRIDVTTATGTLITLQQQHGPPPGRVLVSLDVNHLPVMMATAEHETPEAVDHKLREHLGPPPVYLPAFRSILDATQRVGAPFETYYHPMHDQNLSQGDTEQINQIMRRLQIEESRSSFGRARAHSNDRGYAIAIRTFLCRRWFGKLVPIIRYPSLWDVAREMQMELQGAQIQLAQTDQRILTSVFVQVLKATLSLPSKQGKTDLASLLASVRERVDALESQSSSLPVAYSELRKLVGSQTALDPSREPILKEVLQVYEDALREREETQRGAFQRIHQFQNSLNSFLEQKKLVFGSGEGDRRPGLVPLVKSSDGHEYALDILSSGERHVLTLLFSATHMSAADGTVLIDEPELSLHVGWQRIILSELRKQAGDRQIIACTHSPEVAADHTDIMTELRPTAWEAGENFGKDDLDFGAASANDE